MLARLGYPLSRLLQKRFAEGSKLAMRQSVRDRWLIEVIGHAGDNRHHLCFWANLAGSLPSNLLLQTVGGNVQSCGYETHRGPIRRSIAGLRHLTHVVRKSGKLYGHH